MKVNRHVKIVELVNKYSIETQEELTELLKQEGFQVTQATVSRDIKELGIIKVPSSDGGSVYSLPEAVSEPNRNRVDMVSDSIKAVNSALHTIVINTFPGMASAVAAAVDSVMHNDILGSVAGDDTILLVVKTSQGALELEAELREIFKIK